MTNHKRNSSADDEFVSTGCAITLGVVLILGLAMICATTLAAIYLIAV